MLRDLRHPLVNFLRRDLQIKVYWRGAILFAALGIFSVRSIQEVEQVLTATEGTRSSQDQIQMRIKRFGIE